MDVFSRHLQRFATNSKKVIAIKKKKVIAINVAQWEGLRMEVPPPSLQLETDWCFITSQNELLCLYFPVSVLIMTPIFFHGGETIVQVFGIGFLFCLISGVTVFF